jgi:hypothetical protein
MRVSERSVALEPALGLVGDRRGLEALQALEKIGCGMPAMPGVQQEGSTGPNQDPDRNYERRNQYTCQDDQQCHMARVVRPARPALPIYHGCFKAVRVRTAAGGRPPDPVRQSG